MNAHTVITAAPVISAHSTTLPPQDREPPRDLSTPRPAAAHLAQHDRVTLVLPCGTGKTLLSQRLAQHEARHGSSTILVLVPSVAPLKQTLDSWVKHSARRLNDLDPHWYRPAAPQRLTGAPTDPLLTHEEV